MSNPFSIANDQNIYTKISAIIEYLKFIFNEWKIATFDFKDDKIDLNKEILQKEIENLEKITVTEDLWKQILQDKIFIQLNNDYFVNHIENNVISGICWICFTYSEYLNNLKVNFDTKTSNSIQYPTFSELSINGQQTNQDNINFANNDNDNDQNSNNTHKPSDPNTISYLYVSIPEKASNLKNHPINEEIIFDNENSLNNHHTEHNNSNTEPNNYPNHSDRSNTDGLNTSTIPLNVQNSNKNTTWFKKIHNRCCYNFNTFFICAVYCSICALFGFGLVKFFQSL